VIDNSIETSSDIYMGVEMEETDLIFDEIVEEEERF